MGAWHVNDVSEFHDVLSGDGILEYWTADGAVSQRSSRPATSWSSRARSIATAR